MNVKCFARVALFVTLVAGFVFGVSAPASAHAHLVSSNPASDSTAPTAPTAIELTFEAPVEVGFSKVTVTDAGGAVLKVDKPAVGANKNSIVAAVHGVGEGKHTVAWSVGSADGHPV